MMFSSLYNKIKSYFLPNDNNINNKRKLTESIEILENNEIIFNQNNKENEINDVSVYNNIFKRDSIRNTKFKDNFVEKNETIKAKKQKFELSMKDRQEASRLIETLDLKVKYLPTVNTSEHKSNGNMSIFTKIKSSIMSIIHLLKCLCCFLAQGELSHYAFKSKSHLNNPNLTEIIKKPSLFIECAQKDLINLEAESVLNQNEVNRLESENMEDMRMKFLEMWTTQPTIFPRYVKKTSLPAITEEMRILVSNKLMGKRKDSVIVEEFSLSITIIDLISLQPRQWLTDNIINFYLELINTRNNNFTKYPKIQILTSFFYPKLASAGYSGVKRWTKRRPIFESEIVLVPIHLGNHWCLVTIDLDRQEVFYYDSLKNPNKQILNHIENFLIEDSKDKLNRQLKTQDWIFKQKFDGPVQNNGYDCGVFLCQTAEYASRRVKLDFKQDQMDYFREKMSYEILASRLL